jgi:uncharacterized protein (TIGR01244 family)
MKPGHRALPIIALLTALAPVLHGAESPAPVAGIVAPNVVVVNERLVTAGQPDRASLSRLRAEGFEAVINFAPGDTADAVADEAAILRAQGVDYVHIPIPWQAPESKHLVAMAEAMDRLQGRKVLVHCQMNMRASAMTFLHRAIHAKEDSATAWQDVKKVWTPTNQWSRFITAELTRAGLPDVQPAPTPAARLAVLEDREAIRLLLRDYGRLLDERRFDDFGRLFAADGEYLSGGTTTRGPEGIAAGLRRIMAGNPLKLGEPNFHVLFNERIELDGDRARSTSQSFFVAPGSDGAPQLVLMASYEDQLVRTAEGWRFAKRLVRSNLAPRPAERR